jgi:hypothetical protein
MSLIKQRLLECDRLLGKSSPSVFELEYAALQIRKISESLAYACVHALGSRSSQISKRLLDEYRADKIIKRVIAIDKDCFPRPVHVKLNFETRVHEISKTEDFLPVYLTVIDNYIKCDAILHEFKPSYGPTSENNPIDALRGALKTLHSLVWVHRTRVGSETLVVIMEGNPQDPPVTIHATDVQEHGHQDIAPDHPE